MSSAARLPDSFDDRDSVEAWDSGADAWEEFVESGADYYRTELHGPALLAVCGDVSEIRALDVGCGQGWFSQAAGPPERQSVGNRHLGTADS